MAERARTALAAATMGTLVAGRCPSPPTLTLVSIEDRPDGRPLVRLDQSSPTARLVAACPVATLSVPGPDPFHALDLTGPMNPCRPNRDGARAYRMSLLTARLVGTTTVPLPLPEFYAARPDPLRERAPAALRHLESAHSEELVACVQAHGHEAQAVVPRALDRYGVELAAIGPDGVRQVRLPFPGGPIDDLDQVTTGLRLLLTCRCDG